MAKKPLSEISKGILEGLNEESETVKEDNGISIKEQKSNEAENKKKKRSFMLTEKQISLLYELKYNIVDKDLSTIVGEAIEMYYKENGKRGL